MAGDRGGAPLDAAAWRRAGLRRGPLRRLPRLRSRRPCAAVPFGHGDGYTTWEYLALEATAAPTKGADATVRLRLRSTGRRAGREVVQLYAERADGAVERPPRWLVGVAGVEAGPGEEVALEIAVPARALAHWDGRGWAVEPGTFGLAAGRSSRDLRVRAELGAG